MRYRVIYFQCLCYLALPLCMVSMHLTRCVFLFPLFFLNFLFLKLQFMRRKMHISLLNHIVYTEPVARHIVWVCLSVCLMTTSVSPTKRDELIEMPSG